MSEVVDRAAAFEAWLAELEALAAEEGCPQLINQTGREAWLESFNEGDTPADAWATEKSYAADDVA